MTNAELVKQAIDERTKKLADEQKSPASPPMAFYRQHATIECLVEYIDSKFAAKEIKDESGSKRNELEKKQGKPSASDTKGSAARASL